MKLEDYKKYNDSQSELLYFDNKVCFRCKKLVRILNEEYSLIENRRVNNEHEIKVSWSEYFYFHKKCFIEVAGMDYVIE